MTEHSRSSSIASSSSSRHALQVGPHSLYQARPLATSSPPPPPPLASLSSPSPSKTSLSSPPYRYGVQQAPSLAQQMYRTPPPPSARGASGGSGRGTTTGEDSVGESFLALNSDSSPLGVESSATYGGTREQSHEGAVSSYSSPSTKLTPSSQQGVNAKSDLQTPADAFADAEPTDMSSPRFRSKSRGTRLGMQMGTLKASASATPSTSGASLASSRATVESSSARVPPSAGSKISGTPVEAVQPLGVRTNGSSAVERVTLPEQSNEDGPRVARTPSLSSRAPSQPAYDAAISSAVDKVNVGQLSDGAIVQLGATPGMDPASLLNADGMPLSSKNILTIALQKAQSAVLLDSSNNVSEAIMAYRQAVRLLQEVMERVSPKLGSAATVTSRQSSRRHNREEERRRLKVIHDTYADRIRLLSMINVPDAEEESSRTDESDFLLADTGDSTMGSETFDAQEGSLARAAQSASHTDSPSQAQAPVISISRETNGRMTPVTQGVGEEEKRIEDEVLTPTTPYFDVDPLLGSNDETYGVGRDHELATPRHAALLDAPAMTMSGSAQSAPSGYGRRPPHQASVTTQRNRHQDFSTQRAQTPPTRPSQSTPPSTNRVNPASDAAIVSPTTSTGSISQRRKVSNAAANVYTPVGSSSDPPDVVTSTTPTAGAPAASSALADGVEERDTLRSSSSSSSGRKRAISQPGSRRPSIPASFLAAAGRLAGGASAQQPSPPPLPPVPPLMPTIARKASMPLNLIAQAQGGNDGNDGMYSQLTVKGLPAGRPLLSPSPSTYSGYHTLGTPLGMSFPVSDIGGGGGGGSSGGLVGADSGLYGEKSTILDDLFPSALPSLQLGTHASFASNATALNLPWLGIHNLHPDADKATVPDARVLRPFHTMRQLRASIDRGAHLTDRLFVPREVWLQSGSRLLAVETKVRMVELMTASLEGVEQAGLFLLQDPASHPPGSTSVRVARFVKQLDEVEIVMDEVQVTLGKKLGNLDGGGGVTAGHNTSTTSGSSISQGGSHSMSKRSNMNAFNSLSSKLQRSLNSMVAHNSKHAIDAPQAYVDALARLFVRAQVLDDHLSAVLRATGSGGVHEAYGALSDELRVPIELRLKRSSHFFAGVILRFVLRDISILVDKSVKRSAAMMVE